MFCSFPTKFPKLPLRELTHVVCRFKGHVEPHFLISHLTSPKKILKSPKSKIPSSSSQTTLQ